MVERKWAGFPWGEVHDAVRSFGGVLPENRGQRHSVGLGTAQRQKRHKKLTLARAQEEPTLPTLV